MNPFLRVLLLFSPINNEVCSFKRIMFLITSLETKHLIRPASRWFSEIRSNR